MGAFIVNLGNSLKAFEDKTEALPEPLKIVLSLAGLGLFGLSLFGALVLSSSPY